MVEFIQAAKHYRDMDETQKQSLIDNLTESLMFVERDVQIKVLTCFYNVDHNLGTALEKRLIF